MKIYTQAGAEAITSQHFGFESSFGPFIRFLKAKQAKSSDIRVKFYRYLVKKFEQHPHLMVPFTNVEMLEQHDELVQLLRMSLLPLSSNSDDVSMALAFLQPSALFYYTPLFKETFIDENIEFNTNDDEIGNLRCFVKLILERCYGVKSDVGVKIIKQVRSTTHHSLRHHQLSIDTSYIDIHVDEPLPEYKDEWLELLTVEDEAFLEQFKSFPSRQFRLEGFCMLVANDVSESIALNQLKNAVLNMHTLPMNNILDSVETAIGELVNDSRIKIGITPFFKINGRVVYDRSFNTKSIGVANKEDNKEMGLPIHEVYEKLSASTLPYIYSCVNKNMVQEHPYLGTLHDRGINCFMVYPVKTRDTLIGVFEIGSPEDCIDQNTINAMRPALPLITDLINYMIDVFDARIERLVKEKFTPLQRSVEWKFNEVAWNFLQQQNSNSKNPVIGNVVFQDVYPLYAAVDIRNSSVERNKASQNDYLAQLNQTLRILRKVAATVDLPLVESIIFKCERLANSVSDLLTSEDELKLREFLDLEVKVLFNHVAERHTELAPAIADYMEKTDLETGEFHKNHRGYEESVRLINKRMNDFFEQELKILQSVYPFYYEKYRTDGVEYNIYLGSSIAPDKPFNYIYLKNLRAWQISSMAEITRLNNEVCASLPLGLQTTQLILVHGNAIDISFRKDERRFDVEGAYNIRYEILKKRIDKVRIKGSMERLTQPGKIAIVYSNSAEIQEYLHHIEYLQNKGQLTDTLEVLDLENLQGISGLKALRVGVQLEDKKVEKMERLFEAVN